MIARLASTTREKEAVARRRDSAPTRRLGHRISSHLEAARPGRLAAYLCAVFAVLQSAYILAGIRFDATSLGWFYQYLDPLLLRTRLLESVFYLHSQPPLFNLFLGVVLKLASGNAALLFQGLYLAAGLAFYLALFALLRRLGVGRGLALLLSTLFVASPSFVLYENWLFYTFPLALLMTLAALSLSELLKKKTTRAAWAFFGVLFLLAATRSFFHLAYFALVAGAVMFVLRRDGLRRAIGPLVVSGCLLTALYGKNLVLFGKFTTSTWLGMNVWTMTARNLPLSVRQQWVAEGKLSELSLIDRFAELEAYPPRYQGDRRFADIPALSDTRKSTGYPNYNNTAYIAISDQYLKDALYVLQQDPRTFLTGILRSWFTYFKSSSDYVFLEQNGARIAPIEDLYNYLFYGKIPYDLSKIPQLPIYTNLSRHYVYLFLLLGLPLLFLFGLRAAVKGHAGGLTLTSDQRALVVFVCFNIGFVALVGNLLEAGENNRFRFMTDPLSLALLGLFLQGVATKRKAFSTPRNNGA